MTVDELIVNEVKLPNLVHPGNRETLLPMRCHLAPARLFGWPGIAERPIRLEPPHFHTKSYLSKQGKAEQSYRLHTIILRRSDDDIRVCRTAPAWCEGQA